MHTEQSCLKKNLTTNYLDLNVSSSESVLNFERIGSVYFKSKE